jgi:thimet oligopeptidase
MKWQTILGVLTVFWTMTNDATSAASEQSLRKLGDFSEAARKYKVRFELPSFETTPAALKQAVESTIAKGNASLDQIGRLLLSEVTFSNTIGVLDDLSWEVEKVGNRVELLKETSPSEALRDAATELTKTIQEWAVGLSYREDVYLRVNAYAETKPKLNGEIARLLEYTLRDYRRAGLHLPKADRALVEQWRKEEARLSTDFQANITKATQAVKFTKAELEGVPDSFLEMQGIKTGPDEYTIMVNVTFQSLAILENAKQEVVRRKVMELGYNLAREVNLPIIQKLIEIRDRIARKLGYASWGDYQIEPRMAKTARAAIEFEEQLKAGLEPKFAAELEEFRKLKAEETGDAKAQIQLWDAAYFSNQLKKKRYAVDAEQLRVFFPYDRVLQGMFDIYQSIFGLKFAEVEAPYKWVDDLKLYAVSDQATGEPLGLFYLDMFPREGKFNHFALFGITGGKRLQDGSYQRPVAALVCNFPPPQPGKPSLLKHSEVETLFHEFGHAIHDLVTRANYSRFAGTSVPRDFVEAPSQMLQNWVWDKKVLDRFAVDYRDPSRKIPGEILDQLKASRLAVHGSWYRRQLAFGLMDLKLHTQVRDGAGTDCVKLANEVLSAVYLPVPPQSAFIARFGHLAGYDAGYYGYAWADAISADLATVFESAPGGYLDASAGRKLRQEIYEPGDSRDPNESIARFLGRDRSLQPFLKQIGVTAK